MIKTSNEYVKKLDKDKIICICYESWPTFIYLFIQHIKHIFIPISENKPSNHLTQLPTKSLVIVNC